VLLQPDTKYISTRMISCEPDATANVSAVILIFGRGPIVMEMGLLHPLIELESEEATWTWKLVNHVQTVKFDSGMLSRC
jgi:hypothetical protein